MFVCSLSVFFVFTTFLDPNEFSVTMAVDMGSDSYKIALTRPGNYMEVVLNTESNRKSLNSVGFSPNERFVGDNAYSSARKFPKSTFRHPQFLLGHSFNSDLVNLYLQRFPHADIRKNATTGNVIFSAENFSEDFSPESLLSMIITDAQTSAGVFSKSEVKNLAVVVRAFTDQTQRIYYQKAAQIAKMKLVEIVDSNVATGIRYLVAKYGKMPKKLHNFMIVDVGAYHTDATVYSCEELYENKNKKKPYPSCSIIGYGYTFKGVGDFDSKIVDIIIEKFEKSKNIKYNTIGNARRNFTLLEEARRIKKVLTSVPQTRIYLESFYRDEDFNSAITLAEMESQCKDYVNSMLDAIDQSLRSSNISVSDLTQVVLMGGGSRIPMVQSVIKEKTKIDRLSNILNTDEDGVLGATFILASTSKFFKVKKLVVHKAAVYPIVASYNKNETNADGAIVQRTVEKVIYNHMQLTTQGKVLTIKNITDDFSVVLKYGQIPEYYDHSSIVASNEILHKYDIKGVKEAIEKNKEDYDFDMIKVHVSFDEFGAVSITSAEAAFVKKESPSTFNIIKEKVSNLFSKKSKDENNVGDESSAGAVNDNLAQAANLTNTEGEPKIDETNGTNKNFTIFKTNHTAAVNQTVDDLFMKNATAAMASQNITNNAAEDAAAKDKVKTTTPPPKKKLPKTLKHRLSIMKNSTESKIIPTEDEIYYYREKIRLIRKKEIEKERDAAAMSKLESFINECKYNLESDGKYAEFVNSEELSKFNVAVEEKSAWFDEHGYQSNATVNNNVLKELNETLAIVYDRIHEKELMEDLVASSPLLLERMQQLLTLINNSTEIVKAAFNMTNVLDFSDNINRLKVLTTVDYEKWLKVKPWENKPFNSKNVTTLIDSLQNESIQHISTITKVNKEIERKVKEEERKKKAAEKAAKKAAKEAAEKSATNESVSVDANNSTSFNSTASNSTVTTPSPEETTKAPPKDEL